MNYLLASDSGNHTALGHVMDKKGIFLSKETLDVGIIGDVSMQMMTMLLGLVLLLFFLPRAAKAIQTGPESDGYDRYVTKGRINQIIEVIALYLRDVMLEPVMGKADTKKYFPFLMTMFFFILMMNLLGLIPLPDVQNIIGKFTTGNDHWSVIGGTPTSNIAVTVALALVSFVMIQIHSFRELGILGWLDHLTCGLAKGPKFLLLIVPVIFVVELAGVFIKPVALAVRLFANMFGGHVLLASLLLLGPSFLKPETGLTLGVTGISIISGLASVMITFLELFVAFLQAFIFMFLTAVFISLMSHHDEHDEEHAHEEGASQPAH